MSRGGTAGFPVSFGSALVPLGLLFVQLGLCPLEVVVIKVTDCPRGGDSGILGDHGEEVGVFEVIEQALTLL